MLTWSSPSICPLDYFDSDRTDMRRRNLSEDHDGGSDPEREIRNRRQKLSFDHEDFKTEPFPTETDQKKAFWSLTLTGL